LIGRSYEKLKQAGALDATEADAAIRTTYEAVIQNYPDCPAVPIANHWLRKNEP